MAGFLQYLPPMGLTVDQITREALALPEEQRARLTDALAESLPEPPLSEAWANELMSRVEDLRSGRIQPIPGDEVMKEMLSIVKVKIEYHPEARAEFRQATRSYNGQYGTRARFVTAVQEL